MSREVAHLHPVLQPLCLLFLEECEAEDIKVILTCTYRPGSEQDALYALGRTVKSHVGVKPWRPLGSTVTNARAGQSPHNYTLNHKPASMAFDGAILDGKNCIWNVKHPHWKRYAEIAEDIGLKSGSKWGDWPHVELREFKL